MAVETASGSPSRWLRHGTHPLHLVADKPSFADKQRIDSVIGQLKSPNVDVRQQAAEALASMATGSLAPAVVMNLGELLDCLKDVATPVRSALLNTVRALAENGEAIAVSLGAHRLVDCLQDDDPLIQRKAAVLFRVLSEEGAAAMMAVHVPKLMECFRTSKYSLLAPLEALAAIAEAGEVAAVASVVSTLVGGLKDMCPRIRSGACKTLSAIVHGGGVDSLRRLELLENNDRAGTGEESPTSSSCTTLPEILVSLALEDEDRDVRLTAAAALQAIVEADPSSRDVLREKHAFLLFKSIYNQKMRTDCEIRNILAAILGVELKRDDQSERTEIATPAGEDCGIAGECVICLVSIKSNGPSETLPCGHLFHAPCIHEWFRLKAKLKHMKSCPLCRSCGNAVKPVPTPTRVRISTRAPTTIVRTVARSDRSRSASAVQTRATRRTRA